MGKLEYRLYFTKVTRWRLITILIGVTNEKYRFTLKVFISSKGIPESRGD